MTKKEIRGDPMWRGAGGGGGEEKLGTHKDNLGLIKLLLDLHDRVGLLRVLVLSHVLAQLDVPDRLGPRLGRVVVDELLKEGERHPSRVVGRGDGGRWQNGEGRRRSGPRTRAVGERRVQSMVSSWKREGPQRNDGWIVRGWRDRDVAGEREEAQAQEQKGTRSVSKNLIASIKRRVRTCDGTLPVDAADVAALLDTDALAVGRPAGDGGREEDEALLDGPAREERVVGKVCGGRQHCRLGRGCRGERKERERQNLHTCEEVGRSWLGEQADDGV